jgi:hypothetical protein
MSDQTLASLTAAAPAAGGLYYGTQAGADRKFTLTAAGAALCEAGSAAEQRTALELGALAALSPGSDVANWLATPSETNLKAATSGLAWLDTAQAFTNVLTVQAGSSAGDTIARFENASGLGLTIRTSNATDFGGSFVGSPILAFDYDNFFIKGSVYLQNSGATIYLGQITMTTSGSGFVFLTGGSTALAGTHIRLGNDSTYQGNLVIHSGDNTSVLTITPSGDLTTSGSLKVGSTGTAHSKIKSGTAVLVAGTVTVSDSDVLETGTAATSSRIFITRMVDGGTPGNSYTITRVNATSFTITGMSAGTTQTLDTSTVSWAMLNP